MKILLVQPPSKVKVMDKIFMHEPLALEYVGAGLKNAGHNVTLIDCRIDEDVMAFFHQEKPDAVGITGFTSQCRAMKEIALQIKGVNPNVFVFIGGHHATVCPNDFNENYIDAVVIGEGVFTAIEIMQKVSNGESIEDVKGIGIHGETMRINESRQNMPADDLPFPDRSLTEKYREHYFDEWYRPLASIRTSVGCFARCNFCALWKITNGKYLQRSPESVLDELKSIKEENVFFCDDESMRNVKRMDQLADLIRQAGIKKKYFLYARVDTIIRAPELFAKWKDVGLEQVFIGFESFSNEQLEKLNKNITVEQQEQAVKIMSDIGIDIHAAFLVDPDFSKEDFSDMITYIRHLKLTYANFTILTPLPGTDLYDRQKDSLITNNSDMFDLMHAVLPTRLEPKEFYKQYALLYKKAIPIRHVLKNLSRFGFKGMFSQIKVFNEFFANVNESHIDH